MICAIMIEKVIHLNDPANIIGAICGDILPRFRSDNPENITCQFCAYKLAMKVKDNERLATTRLREIPTQIQGQLFEAIPVSSQ